MFKIVKEASSDTGKFLPLKKPRRFKGLTLPVEWKDYVETLRYDILFKRSDAVDGLLDEEVEASSIMLRSPSELREVLNSYDEKEVKTVCEMSTRSSVPRPSV